MKKHKILVAVPTMSTVPVGFLTSFASLKTNGMAKLGIVSNSLVYEARNSLAIKAMEQGCDYIMWLDSDMVFDPDVMLRLIEDAERLKADYVTGLYFSRSYPVQPMLLKKVEWGMAEDGEISRTGDLYFDYPRDSVFECEGGGFGCVLTSTKLIAEVAEKFKQSPFAPLPAFGEDFSFCWRVKQLGKKMYCDSRVKCGHVGQFVFCESTYLKQKAKEERDAE